MQRSELQGGPVHAGRLQNIREIASLVNAGGDTGTIFERIVLAVCQHTSWTRSGIMAVDRSIGYSVLVTRFEPKAEREAELPTRWALSTSPSLRVVESKQPVVIENAQKNQEFPGYREDAIARGYHTSVVLPLGCSDLQGREMVLSVSSDQRVSVTSEELDFLLTIGQLAGIAVERTKLLHAERDVATRLESIFDLNSNLLRRVLHGSSMPMITGIIEAILPDPFIIVDMTTDNLYVSRSPDAERFSDREWAELVRGPAFRSLLKAVQQAKPSDFQRLSKIRFEEGESAFEHQSYVEPLEVDGDVVGGLIIFPRRRSLDKLDLLIAVDVKFALSVQLMRTHIQQQSLESQLTELFTLLFEGRWSDARQMQIRATRLGIDLSVPAMLLALGFEQPEVGERFDLKHLLRSLDRRLKQAHSGMAVFDYGGTLFVHAPCSSEGAEPMTTTICRQLLETMQWHGRSRPILAHGLVCRQVDDFRGAHENCLRLITLARIFGRQGVVRQQDFGPFAVLLSALDQKAAFAFTHEVLGRIETYDTANNAELLRTAAAFIDQGCRFQSTAEFLGIHISTLRYRLQRIEELFGLDLEDAEQRFSLALAVRLRSLLRNSSS